jgi:cytidylate kinase
MKSTRDTFSYMPGFYTPKRPTAAQLADRYIRGWEHRKQELKRRARQSAHRLIPPTIAVSRKIGVGALEIADLLSETNGLRVVDRDIIEQIASESKLSETTVAMFDERYPGWREELMALLFGEKSFIKSDYARKLFETVLAIAAIESTIFVGRGVHLILPRDRVLAVRFISSGAHRIERLAKIMDIPAAEAQAELNRADKEQRDFFKKTFKKSDARASEFDLIINCDHISDPQGSAAIVERAFEEKFGSTDGI